MFAWAPCVWATSGQQMPTVTRVLLQLHLAFCSECNLYTTVMLGHCRRLVVILLFCKGQNWGPVEGQIMRLVHQQQTSQHADKPIGYTYLLTRENRYSRSFHCRSTIHSAIFTQHWRVTRSRTRRTGRQANGTGFVARAWTIADARRSMKSRKSSGSSSSIWVSV